MQLFCSTAAATFRQAVALVFDRVVLAESLPAGKFGFGRQLSRTSSVTGDVNRSINFSEYAFPFVNTIADHYSFNMFCSLKCVCKLILFGLNALLVCLFWLIYDFGLLISKYENLGPQFIKFQQFFSPLNFGLIFTNVSC
jgi:hypothetical protein